MLHGFEVAVYFQVSRKEYWMETVRCPLTTNMESVPLATVCAVVDKVAARAQE
jgi:hypothetical protein